MTTVLQATLGLALVLLVARALRGVLDRARQPPVMAEVLAGLVLGATLLGQLPGDPSGRLFTPGAREVLTVVGQVALALYLLGVGARIDPRAVRREGRAVLAVAAAAFAVPFAAGAALALALHGGVAGDPPRGPFVLFLGTAIAVTAFPVLARIVDARGLADRPAGRIAIAAAAVQELLVWPALAVAVSLGGAGEPLGPAAPLAVLAALVLARVARGDLGLLLGVGLSAAATELAGLHLVLGAFLFGAALPAPRREQARALMAKRPVTAALALTLPAAFAIPALRVDVWALGTGGLALFVLVLAVAAGAKLLSAAGAAIAAGVERGEALAVGALMNARGLVELVVLSVGLQAGLLDERLFAVMVLMALATTFAAGPLSERARRASGGASSRARPRRGSPPPRSSPAARSG